MARSASMASATSPATGRARTASRFFIELEQPT
jgi:hypothetical protein